MTQEGGNHSSLSILGTGISLEEMGETTSPKALTQGGGIIQGGMSVHHTLGNSSEGRQRAYKFF